LILSTLGDVSILCVGSFSTDLVNNVVDRNKQIQIQDDFPLESLNLFVINIVKGWFVITSYLMADSSSNVFSK
jgi:hypothetical protein